MEEVSMHAESDNKRTTTGEFIKGSERFKGTILGTAATNTCGNGKTATGFRLGSGWTPKAKRNLR